MISNRLLLRQLRKVLGSDAAAPDSWMSLLTLVDEAYDQFDADRKLLQRSMDISSEELITVNSALRAEKKRHDQIFERLKQSLRDLRSDMEVEEIEDEDVLSLSDLIYDEIRRRNDAEEQLREREQRLRLILESTHDYAIFTLDRAGRVASWNSAAARITGYSDTDIIGKCHTIFHTPDQRSAEIGTRQLEQTALAGETSSQGWRARRDGSLYWADVTLAALRDESGKLQGYVCVSKDITERRRAQEALRVAKERAEAASHAKSEFLANMSHEIRTPMNAVIGLTDSLLRTEMTAEQLEVVQTIHTSGQGLLSIIQDVLDLSKIEAGQLTLSQSRFDLHACIRGVSDMFAPSLRNVPVSLRVEFDASAPKWATSDEARIRQVIVNLVGNAIKYTQQGEVVVHVSASPCASGSQVHFEISDTGIGIPTSAIPTLFDPFTQVNDRRSHGQTGTGLGLAISKRYAEALGGEIWVESQENVGSTFHFTIKLQAQQRASDRPPKQHIHEPVHVAASDTRILVAEDNPVNQLVVRRLLESIGFTCEVVPDGKQALEYVRTCGCDVVFMDLQMPEMGGIDATLAIRADPEITQPRIIALTAFAMAEDRTRCLEAGMDDFVTKPVVASDLRNALSRISA